MYFTKLQAQEQLFKMVWFSLGKQAPQQASNDVCNATAEMYCQRKKSWDNKAIKICNTVNHLKRPPNSCWGLCFWKQLVTPTRDTLSKHLIFWKSAVWKPILFHKLPHVRQLKPLLKKLTQISEVQKSFTGTYLLLHLQKKNWCTGLSQMAAALWLNAPSAGCSHLEESQPLSADLHHSRHWASHSDPCSEAREFWDAA